MPKHSCQFCGKELNVKVDGYWICNKKKCRIASIDYLINKYAKLMDELAHDD